MKNIFILGLSKTGTTAIAQAIYDGSSESQKSLNLEPSEFGNQKPNDRNNKWHQDACIKGGVVTKCLIHPIKELSAWDDAFECADIYTHKIWIDRDPRDRLISHNLYRWYKGHSTGLDKFGKKRWEQKFLDTLAKVKSIEENPGSLPFIDLCDNWWLPGHQYQFLMQSFGLYHSIMKMRAKMKGWYFIRYEDFIDGNLEGLEDYLGFSIENKVEVKQKRIVRSKSYGSWRQWFSEEDILMMKPIYHYYLYANGYDADDWRLDNPDQLDPSLGSEYIKKIHYKL